MRYFVVFLMLLSLGMFAMGCGDGAKPPADGGDDAGPGPDDTGGDDTGGDDTGDDTGGDDMGGDDTGGDDTGGDDAPPVE